jgi:hypothetical protein
MKDVIIVDNSPAAYLFQPENALPCISWYEDPRDTELYEFIPMLQTMSELDDVRDFLQPCVTDGYFHIDKCVKIMKTAMDAKIEKSAKKEREILASASK